MINLACPKEIMTLQKVKHWKNKKYCC